MRNLRRLIRKNPWAFWLTTAIVVLAILGGLKALYDMLPSTRISRHVDAGIKHLEEKNYPKAKDEFNAALELQPEFAIALYGRGEAAGRLGNSQQQLDDCKKATEKKSEFALAWFCVGVAQYALGYPKKANESFDRAIELADPERLGRNLSEEVNIEARLNKVELWLNEKEKEPEDAIVILEEVLAKTNDYDREENYNHFAYNLLGRAYRDQGKLSDSLDAYDQAILNKANYHPALVGRLMTLNQMEEEEYKRVITDVNGVFSNLKKYNNLDNKKLAQLLLQKGDSLRKLKRCAEAIDTYKEALQYNPEYQEAEDRIKLTKKSCSN